MFFQVSPVKKFRPKCKLNRQENEEIPVLILAPFTKIPKLSFQNVPVNSCNENSVLVKNPGSDPVAVDVTFEGPDDLNLTLNWNQEIIDRCAEKLLIISWKPKFDFSVRYSIKISCQKNSWSIPISFKTTCSSSPKITPKITVKLSRKSPPLTKKSTRCKKSSSASLPTPGNENVNISNVCTCISDISESGLELDDSMRRKSPDSLQNTLEDIEEFDDSLEIQESPKKRQILTQIQENTPLLGKFLRAEMAICSITPNCRNFHPKRVSSEKKETLDNDYPYLHASFDVRCTENAAISGISSLRTTPNSSIHLDKSGTLDNTEESGVGFLDQTLENKRKTPRFSPCKRRTSPETWSKTESNHKLPRVSKVTLMKNDGKITENTFMVKDPFILAATISIDPFLTSTIHLDENWIMEQELRFKRWFNKLLAPPIELEVTENGQNIDAAKIWTECLKRDVPAAPTKEAVCIKYHTKSKLDILRNTARNFYKSEEMKQVLAKISKAINSGKLEIRPDRNVHLDLVLQKKIITLLLSYNPLWLRIGLETIYNEILLLNSNSDIVGLSRFICERFFKDPYLLKKYKSAHNPKYAKEIKKFILKKYLYLVYFLDKAKCNTLIRHDPCLFRRNSLIKESREILIQFSKDAITGGIGDINRYLRYFGYIVNHKQFFIHEYDYAVTNLGTDLRDGVRLVRVMELILLRDDLTEKLRVPTISRLQKIHNVKLAFKSLEEAKFEIQHDIEAAHIVDGHRDKTLSFLWQIIYKFQAPLLVKTVEDIQKWWRSFPICAKRLQLQKIRNHKSECAKKIQKWYKRHCIAKKLLVFSKNLKEFLEHRKRERAAIKIQSFFRMYKERKKFVNIKSSIVKLQKHCKLWLEKRRKIHAAVVIQKNYKKFVARSAFLKLKTTVLSIENRYEAKKLMLKHKKQYENLKRSTIIIQQWFRLTIAMRKTRNEYLNLKKNVVSIQRMYRNKLGARKIMQEYHSIKKSTILIQTWYRSVKIMQKQRLEFCKLKNSVLIIENYYINYKKMKIQRNLFLNKRKSIVVIQKYFRAYLQMKNCRKTFVELKTSAIIIQRQFRAYRIQIEYKTLRKAAITIQRMYRRKKLARAQRREFLYIKQCCIKIQKYFRCFLLMRKQREYFVSLQRSVRFVQSIYRAKVCMEYCKVQYLELRTSTIYIQQKFRANKLMKIEKTAYESLRNATILVQSKFRARKLMLEARNNYEKFRNSVIYIQRKYRANKKMKIQRNLYLQKKNAVTILQNHFRSYLKMKEDFELFTTKRKSALIIQQWYKSYKSMIMLKNYYELLRTAAVKIQLRFRSNQLMKKSRRLFLKQKQSCILIQRFYRSLLLMRAERQQYNKLKTAAIFIQNKYKAKKSMEICKENYGKLRATTVYIQQKFRATKQMKILRLEYIKRKTAAIKIQQYFRGYQQMKNDRGRFLRIISATNCIQKFTRGFLTRKKYGHLLTPEAREARRIRRLQEAAAIKIQAYWRGYRCRSQNGEKMKLIRRRSQIAEQNANTQNTLGSRCQSALEMLTSESITYALITGALSDLEYVTRRSVEICRAYAPILPEQMYIMIISSGRSLPEVKMNELSTLILLNFCKYPPTNAMTWIPKYLDGVIDTMMHWCDKEDLVFPALSTLLWVFGHNENYKETILNLPMFYNKMEKIRVSLVRKEKMVSKSKKILFSRFHPYRSLPLPDLKPDWGFDYPNRPRTFTNSIHALECLIDIFNLS